MSDDIIRWGELTLKSSVTSDDAETVDAVFDLDDFQFWFEPHPEFPGSMRISISLSGAQWDALKDTALAKDRSGKKVYRAAPSDDITKVVAMLREPSADLVKAAEAYGDCFGPRRNKARPTGEQWEVFAIGSLEMIGAYATHDEAEEVAFRRTLAAKSRATLTAIADYLDQHARTAPEVDGRQAADAMRQVLANHAQRKRAAASAKPNPPPAPEVSEPVSLLPCPFCGSCDIDPRGWMAQDDDCGPQCQGCGATADSLLHWNKRAPEVSEPSREEPHGFKVAAKEWNTEWAGRAMNLADWASLTFGEQARYSDQQRSSEEPSREELIEALERMLRDDSPYAEHCAELVLSRARRA